MVTDSENFNKRSLNNATIIPLGITGAFFSPNGNNLDFIMHEVFKICNNNHFVQPHFFFLYKTMFLWINDMKI